MRDITRDNICRNAIIVSLSTAGETDHGCVNRDGPACWLTLAGVEQATDRVLIGRIGRRSAGCVARREALSEIAPGFIRRGSVPTTAENGPRYGTQASITSTAPEA
jgi:hypothetical protein